MPALPHDLQLHDVRLQTMHSTVALRDSSSSHYRSEGSAFANPAMEQSCGSKQQGVCSKCSLTIEETASYWNNNVQKAEQKELRKSYAAGQAMDQVAFTSQPGMREDMQVSPNADQPRNLRS